MKLKIWLEAARLRTLPLSMSGIVIGSFVAFKEGHWDVLIFSLSIATTLLLQILSNFANDLGDSSKGTDNDNRLGPTRTVQSGKISMRQMTIATVVLAIMSFVSAAVLIVIGTKGMPNSVLWMYFVLAGLSVIAAITYTIGKKAYGYNGMGDVMVFIFFGLVSVLGSYSLFSKSFDPLLILFASAIGFLSMAVLNINNMRDYENDKASGKKTIVVFMGPQKAKIYHLLLIGFSFLFIFLYLLAKQWYLGFISLFPFLFLFLHIYKVWKNEEPKLLDKEMKKVALSTFAISVLFFISTLVA